MKNSFLRETTHQPSSVLKTAAVCQKRPANNLLVAFYLLCALAGAVVPWHFNLEAMQQDNTLMVLGHYFKDGTATPLASSITTDFFIGTLPVLVWMCMEAKRMKWKRWWLLLPATFLVSFAFSCPLFLAIREYNRINASASSPFSSSTQKLFL